MSADEQAAPTTDRGGHGPPSRHVHPYDPAELEALFEAVWSLEGDTDPTRFDELLHAALVFLGRLALEAGWGSPGTSTARAALLLRRMELRATLGPDWPVEQP